MAEVENWKCSKCGKMYQAHQPYSSTPNLLAITDPEDHGEPRLFLALMHVSNLLCPTWMCAGKLVKVVE
jgi:hypothetical protein